MNFMPEYINGGRVERIASRNGQKSADWKQNPIIWTVFLVGAFSLKEKSPTITVGSF